MRGSEIAIVIQDAYSSLNKYMTVGDIIAEPLKLFNKTGNIVKLLELVELAANLKDRYPYELSGGQCRRVNIARALALQPEFLVLDEVTNGLDLRVQASLVKIIKALQAELNLTCLVISHDLDIVEFIANRVAVMLDGKIVEVDQTIQIFKNPRHAYVKGLLNLRLSYL